MISFKNVFKIPFVKWNFFLIILFLALISLISYKVSFFSIIFTILFSVALVSCNLLSTLKVYDSKTIVKILEYSLAYFLSSFIYLIIEGIFALLVFVLIFLLKINLPDGVNNNFVFNSIGISLILLSIVLFVGIIIFEFLKNIGFINFLKTKKFENIYHFKKNLKLIFSKDFSILFIFIVGYTFLLSIIFLILIGIVSLVFPYVTNQVISFLFILFLYVFISVTFTLMFNFLKK